MKKTKNAIMIIIVLIILSLPLTTYLIWLNTKATMGEGYSGIMFITCLMSMLALALSGGYIDDKY
jgi:hypothetical protein